MDWGGRRRGWRWRPGDGDGVCHARRIAHRACRWHRQSLPRPAASTEAAIAPGVGGGGGGGASSVLNGAIPLVIAGGGAGGGAGAGGSPAIVAGRGGGCNGLIGRSWPRHVHWRRRGRWGHAVRWRRRRRHGRPHRHGRNRWRGESGWKWWQCSARSPRWRWGWRGLLRRWGRWRWKPRHSQAPRAAGAARRSLRPARLTSCICGRVGTGFGEVTIRW